MRIYIKIRMKLMNIICIKKYYLDSVKNQSRIDMLSIFIILKSSIKKDFLLQQLIYTMRIEVCTIN